jgi:Domain of unknown function (DUF4333)
MGVHAECSVAAIVLLAAALLAGCSVSVSGGDHTIDSRSMAERVSTYLREQVPGVQIGSVACPEGVKLAEGATLQCTAEVADSQLPVTVTLSHVRTDGDIEEYDYTMVPVKALIDTDEVISQIRSRLPAQAAGATVGCGTPRVRVVDVGGTIACTISLGSKHQVVRAVVDNLQGTVHFVPATVWPVTRPKTPTGRIGDTLTVYDEVGKAQLEATVTRLKFSAGDEFDRPQHGLYMGAYVKLRAHADGQDLIEFTALVGGRNYPGDVITGSTAFDPLLNPVVLNRGEQVSGWLVFDVPARHGQLVMRDLGGHQIGVWKY